jgi:hypothetical protein
VSKNEHSRRNSFFHALIGLCTGTKPRPDGPMAPPDAAAALCVLPDVETGGPMLAESIAAIKTPAMPTTDGAAQTSVSDMRQFFRIACQQRLKTILDMATGWSAKIFEKSRPKNFLRIVIFTLAFSVLINMFSLANAPADDSHFLIMKNLWDGWRAFGAPPRADQIF